MCWFGFWSQVYWTLVTSSHDFAECSFDFEFWFQKEGNFVFLRIRNYCQKEILVSGLEWAWCWPPGAWQFVHPGLSICLISCGIDARSEVCGDVYCVYVHSYTQVCQYMLFFHVASEVVHNCTIFPCFLYFRFLIRLCLPWRIETLKTLKP